jgi:hypothetical protein
MGVLTAAALTGCDRAASPAAVAFKGIDIRPAQPIGSGKLVDRLRLCDSIADDTVLGTVESLGSKSS